MAEHFISREETEDDLLAASTFLAERITSSDGHAEAMSAVIPLYLANKDVDLAAELANTVDDPFTRDRLLSLVAEKCAELDDDEYALQLAESIEDFGMRAKALERIALQKAAKGDFEKAREIADQMDHRDGVLAGIAMKQSVNGADSASAETLREIEFPVDRVHALLEIAISRIAVGEPEKAVALLESAVSAALDIEHNEERIRSLLDAGNLFIEANRKDRAVETFDKSKGYAEALDNIHRDTFLASTAVGFLHAGSIDLADRTLDLVADKTQIASCLLGYAREFWKKSENSEALDSLEEAYAILKSQRDIETRSSKARYALFTAIAVQFAWFEKSERAIEIAQQIEDENEQTAALSQVAGVLTLRNEDEEARHALRSISDDASRTLALITMSDAKEKNGDREGAVALLDESYHWAETVPQLSSRSTVYNEIASRFRAYGETEKFSQAVAINLQTIAAIRDDSRRSVALAQLSAFDPAPEFTDAEKASLAQIIRQK
jgi:tetratricopeptide (TPR) repeat protein